MKDYAVSALMVISAESEAEALELFKKQIISADRDTFEIEKISTGDSDA
jgi:hypothetical protein